MRIPQGPLSLEELVEASSTIVIRGNLLHIPLLLHLNPKP